MRETDDQSGLGELGELLRPILDDPETMEKLTREAEKLGLNDLLSPPSGDDDAANGNNSSAAAAGSSGIGSDSIASMLGKFAPLLSGMARTDDSTRLLHALRPFLGEKRNKRLEEAEKILTVMRLVRLLRESGPDI